MRGARSGPSRKQQRDLFITLVERQFRLRGKRAVISGVWPLLAPLVLLGLYGLVFSSIFAVDLPRYGEFVFAGLLPWSLVAQGLGAGATSLAAEPELIRRVRFPYEFLPMSVIACLAVFFLVDLVGFVAYLAITGAVVVEILPLLIVPTIALVALVMSLATVISLADVYNRDVRVLLANALTVWFFLLPVLYSRQMAGERLQFLRSIDPMNMIIGQYRDILYYGQVPEPSRQIAMLVVCLTFSGACLAVFRRCSPNLPRDV
jgi:lipopolysaccharide transport system permease protein